MGEYKIEIYSTNNKVDTKFKNLKPILIEHHIEINNLSLENAKKVKKYCKRHNIKYNLINSNFERGSSYRRSFFMSNPPSKKGNYFCAYCGRVIPKKDITVDHIIPIYSVKYSLFKQRLLTKIGVPNINCEKNLAPACKGCNIYKGTRGGIWILFGIIGKQQKLWYFRHIIRFIALNIILFFIFQKVLLF